MEEIWRANHFHRNDWVRKQLRTIIPAARLLDAGCGGQPFRKYCNHLDYVSQDFGNLDAESHIIGRAYGPIDYLCDITKIPIDDASIDAVLCTEVFEHIPDPGRDGRDPIGIDAGDPSRAVEQQLR